MKILVDTCVWRHWFTLHSEPSRLNGKTLEHCNSFEAIYQLARLHPNRIMLLFNALVEHELGIRYQLKFSEHITPIAKKIPIPLSRHDGLYKHDGSILRGGRMGGSLRAFLTADGYPHSAKLDETARKLPEGDKLFETVPRRREFDVEHMESALEAKVDLFLTNDESTIINRLQAVAPRFEQDHPINIIAGITKTPTAALPTIRAAAIF